MSEHESRRAYRDDDELKIEEVMAYLGISRATFLSRCRQYHIIPVNFNPALKRQPNPLYRFSDVKKLADIRQMHAAVA